MTEATQYANACTHVHISQVPLRFCFSFGANTHLSQVYGNLASWLGNWSCFVLFFVIVSWHKLQGPYLNVFNYQSLQGKINKTEEMMERSKTLGSLGGCYWLVVPEFFLNWWCQNFPRRGLEASPAVSVFSPTVHDDLEARPDHSDPPLTPLATGCQGWVPPHPSSPTSGEESGCFSGPQRFFSLWTQIHTHCFLLDSCGFCHR